MNQTVDIELKLEKDMARDTNDNIEVMFNVDIKVEKEAETNDDEDWCLENFAAGDLLEPLFFKKVSEPQGIQCSLCYKYFLDLYDVYKHNLTHIQVTIVNPRLFKCDICNSYFDSIKTIERHMPTHNHSITNTLPYKPKGYRNEIDFDFKLKYTNNVKTYVAKHKNKTDKLRDGMTNSLAYKPKTYKSITGNRISDTPHQCKICHKTYSYKHWHAHMQEVHGEGNYTCGICDTNFRCKRYLTKHLEKHMKQKPRGSKRQKPRGLIKMDVECDQCDTVLQNLYALKTHKRNVHSDTKHVCHICKSTLKCKSYLLAHMQRVHSNDGKKHECECGKSFRSHRYLMVHKRNAHLKKKKNEQKKEVFTPESEESEIETTDLILL